MTTSRSTAIVAVGLWLLASLSCPALAGDSLSGKVIEVRSAELVVLDYGTGQYVVHIVGIDVLDQPRAEEAKALVSKLVLGKRARMRFVGRAANGEMVARLLTDEPDGQITDVGLELVRLGLARRAAGTEFKFGYKYGELSAAESEAQRAQRGLWAQPQPR
jgi:endonuclease YncB( thermonuclease family)